MSKPRRRPYYFKDMTAMQRRFFALGMFGVGLVMLWRYPDKTMRAIRDEIMARGG